MSNRVLLSIRRHVKLGHRKHVPAVCFTEQNIRSPEEVAGRLHAINSRPLDAQQQKNCPAGTG